MPLITISSSLYYSEHALFIIPDSSQVTWSGSNSWDSVYSSSNINSYINTLKTNFPDDYFFVAIVADNLLPNKVPNVLTYRYIADGIGEDSISGVGVPNITRYPISGSVIDGCFAVLDHEIGHNWGVFIGSQLGTGHWLSNSTVTGQMSDVFSDDGGYTVKQINGDPLNGFTWTSVDNLARNETETFSDQDLYLQGFASAFPAAYVLNSPVYNPDNSVSYTSVATYDQSWVEAHNGIRSPDYRASEKKLRIAVVYIARDITEILNVYKPIERSISHFSNSETIDTSKFRFQVPFLVETKMRASVNALLADLDGNTTPNITLGSNYVLSSDGAATISYSASDADGPAPAVSCVPISANCSISSGNIVISGLSSGAHFFTVKAQDTGGKKSFEHFVVDVE